MLDAVYFYCLVLPVHGLLLMKPATLLFLLQLLAITVAGLLQLLLLLAVVSRSKDSAAHSYIGAAHFNLQPAAKAAKQSHVLEKYSHQQHTAQLWCTAQ
jgi:positive regulator of sigma E activity